MSASLAHSGERSRGQSMVELALILPVLLLILLVAIDFGRIYLGYVNMQQMVRVAAGFAAEHATAWGPAPDNAIVARYQDMIENDATTVNCELVREGDGTLPDPMFIDGGFTLGNRVEVQINCEFGILTPVISTILGDTVDLTADVVYPIREGAVAEVPGGGGGIVSPPVADFLGTPQSGYEPLEVTFTDESTNGPRSWEWNFGNGSTFGQGPHVRTYNCPDSVPAGGSCQFDVSLRVGGLGGFDTEAKPNYITVYVPPDTGPIAEFEGTPVSGSKPLNVDFDFIDLRGGTVNYTNFQWDFTNDGTFDVQGANETSVSHTYTAEDVYSVRLVVTDDGGNSHELIKLAYIVVDPPVCTVPDFGNLNRSQAQGVWAAAGFTTTVSTLPAGGNNPGRDYKIHYQSIIGGTVDPQPSGCDATITVGP